MLYITKRNQQGFTLMELMITVAIIGILAAISIPSYTSYVTKTKRTEATTEILRIAQLQESYFVQNMSYAKSLKTEAGGLNLASGIWFTTENESYQIRVISVNPSTCTGTNTTPCTSYAIRAKPKAGSSQANDSQCTLIEMDSVGRKKAQTNGSGGTTVEKGKDCWK